MSDEDWEEGFFGKPFEALGNVNEAIYAGGAAGLAARLSEFIENGEMARERALREGDRSTMLLLCPGNASINVGVLISDAVPRRGMTVISMYPVFEGLRNNMVVENFKSWENGFEGMVAADTGETGLIAFFDPFYFWDHWELRLGRKSEFGLAALAFSLEIAKNEEFDITDGPLYDMALAEFLREHPGKTRKDFPTPKMIMGSAQMLWPTDYTGEYHFRALVLGREEVGFLGNPVWRFHISLLIDENIETTEIWLYAAPHVIEGKIPGIGDYIEGFCWMSGYLQLD